MAKQERLKTDRLRADSRAAEAPDLTKASKIVAPLASFDADGILVWDDVIGDRLKKLATPPKKPKRRKKT